MDQVKLLVVGGNTESSEIELALPAVFGRGREASVTLPHPLVSRRHCELFERDGQLIVRDLGSLNGTFVGSERVDESVLEAGQLLTVGTVTFRAIYGGYEYNPATDSSLSRETVLANDPTSGESAETVPVPAKTPKPGKVPTPKMIGRKEKTGQS